jgi:5-(hydroxymethyl)furfural/furfural oxidase
MRSGIGPAGHLASLGVPVRRDLAAVGENLRDHPGVTIMSYIRPSGRVRPGERPLQLSLRHSSQIEGCPPSDLYTGVYSRSGWHGVGYRLGSAVTWVNKPFSAGRVSLQSAAWSDEPKVELNYFDDYRDLARLMRSVRFVASLFEQRPLKEVVRFPFGARWSPKTRRASAVNAKNRVMMGVAGMMLDGPAPLREYLIREHINEGPDLPAILADDALLEDFVRSTVIGIKHLSCTCRMGGADEPRAVTAPDGRVHGVGGLRVADASIMPLLPRCNTNLTTMMIGEKVSDAILAGS